MLDRTNPAPTVVTVNGSLCSTEVHMERIAKAEALLRDALGMPRLFSEAPQTLDDVAFANDDLTAAMRDWLRDCADCYTDITEDDVDDVPRTTVWRIVERDYDGGVAGFTRDNA